MMMIPMPNWRIDQPVETFAGRTMIPILLLLLLPTHAETQTITTDRVCFHVSKTALIMKMTNANITDEQQLLDAKCWLDSPQEPLACLIECNSNNGRWLNGSRPVCFETKIETKQISANFSIRAADINCMIYLCNETVIIPLMTNVIGGSCAQTAMNRLFYIRAACTELFRSNRLVKKTYINMERQMLHDILKMSLLSPEDCTTYSMKNLKLNAIKVNDAAITSAGSNSGIHLKPPQLLPQNASSIPHTWLPADALQEIPEEERLIGLVSYMCPSQFEFEEEDFVSMVVRIELLGQKHLDNLATPLEIIFSDRLHSNVTNDTQLKCFYFDEDELRWKMDGCELYTRTADSKTELVCRCDHATPFAILLIREPISEFHWVILSYISYIGCGLSAFFNAISIVMYIFSRAQKRESSVFIHVSLSSSLFLLNTAFLLTEWGATMEPEWVCMFVAATLHYSLLCTFTWMAIEGLHLYLLLIKVFNTYYKHYTIKLSVAGWGIPGLIVGVSLSVMNYKQLYGPTMMVMADSNQTNNICWITDDTFFYSLNLVYFTLIFIFNSGILLTVGSNIFHMKKVRWTNPKLGSKVEKSSQWDPETFNESFRCCLTVMGLTCLLGTSWGLAFLGSGYTNYTILYLFCILNSTQGFFIFLWICLSVKKEQKREEQTKITSVPMKSSSEVKSD